MVNAATYYISTELSGYGSLLGAVVGIRLL
jgi:hypothetical protein